MAGKSSSTSYGNQSIKSLKGADRVRKKPAVIFGSDDIIGAQHTFIEILANAVDEAREGYGDKIIVKKYLDLSLEVEDFGRGVPLGYNEKEKRFNWELVFCELYAGGKYDNNDGNSAYEYSLGTNGLGAASTQYASDFMTVKSYSGKILSEIDFKAGEPASELRTSDIKSGGKRRGTIIRWRPDIKVFKEIDIPVTFLHDIMYRQSIVNKGVKFILEVEVSKNKFESTEFFYERGIEQHVEEITNGIALTSAVKWQLPEMLGKDREDLKEYKFKADITFCFAKTGIAEYYHNASFLEYGGSPDKAVRVAFVYAIDKFIKSQGKYTKNESKISFADIADNLVIVINSASTHTSFENQTKKSITNVFIQKALTDYIKQNLEIYLTENPNAAQTIMNQVLVNMRSREASEKHKLDIKKKLSGGLDLVSKVDKFIACSSKDPAVREIYIVEGDSAASSCKFGRDADFQAIMPVRGKTLNCMKSTYDKIFASEIIIDLLKVIGCGVEVEGKKGSVSTFNIDDLKWSKIIICTDADEDGFQIRTLLLTMFYRLLPTLIERGKIFIAESPLFEITCGNDTYFAYNEQEKIDVLSKIGSKKYTIQRSKGLGENTPETMWQTTMCPQTRRLIAVTPADAAETAKMFEILLGDAISDRKRYIAENGHLYISEADI